jgi:hypothetical protein
VPDSDVTLASVGYREGSVLPATKESMTQNSCVVVFAANGQNRGNVPARTAAVTSPSKRQKPTRTFSPEAIEHCVRRSMLAGAFGEKGMLRWLVGGHLRDEDLK